MSTSFAPSGPLRGTLVVPPDKSISHRAAIVGAMCEDPVTVANYLDAEDTRSTLDAVRALGAIVESSGDGALVIRGTGLRAAAEPDGPIDVGNAGTLLRLLPGWLAGQDGRAYTLDGDASIRRRPVDRIAEPLRAMGAKLEATDGRYPPFRVTGARLHGIDYELPVASAQVKSCVLFAGMIADGSTAVIEPRATRDHTERLLLRAGVPVSRSGDRIELSHVDELELGAITVPGDASSAAFLIAAALLVRGSRVVLEDVGVNWTRTGFLRILERMGAVVVGELEPEGAPLSAEEPVSELDVAAAPLVGTTVDPEEVPLAIDELPLVALVGCFAEGETIVRGAGELRLKESDRISGVVEGLQGLGAKIEATEDGFVVMGTGGLRGGVIDARGDHRLAMLGAVAGLASEEGVEVSGMEAAAVSWPGFEAAVGALV